jgi:hypothetical protein
MTELNPRGQELSDSGFGVPSSSAIRISSFCLPLEH